MLDTVRVDGVTRNRKETYSMAKYSDKTQDEWDELVEQWHTDESLTMSLPDFLELDETEYMKLAHGIDTPDLTPEEVKEEARKRTVQAAVALTLLECFTSKLHNIF